MGTAERRNAIMKILCRRRFETMPKLAEEFGVSVRTIRRDIEVLSLTEPIYTQSGRYEGGVYVMDGYNIDRAYMTAEESEVLLKVISLADSFKLLGITEKELGVLKSIVRTYTKPTYEKGMMK